ncbi:MAG: GvpL/GvpF family gas vesicle protein [Actinomycetota bacterium]|nr:GvpL/GvpF family gas vesicle protein [Actinomycetota bacterium]
MAETGRYLYAITRDVDHYVLDHLPALGEGRLEVVEQHGLSAVVSTVGLDEYGEEGLTRNLERLEWLEEVARCHDTVVQAMAAIGPTAPLRLATICLDDAAVRHRLDEWYPALQQALDRVEGRMEWSVKAFAPARPAAPTTGEPDEPVGGAEYLRRKKAQTEARHADTEQAMRAADEVHDALARASVASRRLPAQDPRLTGHDREMLLNGAYLVEIAQESAFTDVVQELANAHPELGLSCGGPWAAYSFATLEQR